MGTTNCFAFVQGGGRTQFDILLGLIETVEEEISRADIPAEFHAGDGPVPEGWSKTTTTEIGDGVVPHVIPHFANPKGEILESLAQAKEKVEEIWYLILEAKKALP